MQESLFETSLVVKSKATMLHNSTHAHVVLWGDSQSILVFAFGDFPETHIEAQCRINATWQQKDNREERDNHSIVSLIEYISL